MKWNRKVDRDVDVGVEQMWQGDMCGGGRGGGLGWQLLEG